MSIKLYKKYKEIILYVFFGGCTTLTNIITYLFSTRILNFDSLISNIIAWTISVLFAYFTNKLYVFESNTNSLRSVILEFGSFVSSRLLTGLIDLSLMFIFVNILKVNDIIMKVFVNIIVIIINYVISKFYIFNKIKSN